MADSESARVVSTGAVSARASIRAFTVDFDKPAAKGGRDAAPMPSEVYLAALGSCYTVGFTRIAKVRGVDVRGVEVVVEGTFDKAGEFDRLRMRITVTSPATREQVDVLDKLAERSCTVAALTKVPVERQVTLRAP